MGASVASKLEARSGGQMLLNSRTWVFNVQNNFFSNTYLSPLGYMMMKMMMTMRCVALWEARVLFALWLTVLQGCNHTGAAPGHSSPLQSSNWGNPRRFVHLRTSTDLNNFYLEISLNGHVRKTTHRGSYSKCA